MQTMLLAPSAAISYSPKDQASRSLNGHRADLEFMFGGNTSTCDDQARLPSPVVYIDGEPSSVGQGEEGQRGAEEQKDRKRRSACIVAGGKEKEVGEMREALKRAKDKWLEEATKLEETRKNLLQSHQDSTRSALEAERETLLKELYAKDMQIDSLKASLNVARTQLRAGLKNIVVLESNSFSHMDKATQTSDEEDTSVTSGGDTTRGAECPAMSGESCTELMRTVSVERKAQLAVESVTVCELQSLLETLQQRYEYCGEVVQRISTSPYWQSKKELEKLVEAQRDQVFLKQEMKEKELEKLLKETQCKKTEEFCSNLESCIRFLEDCSKQAAQQKEFERKRSLRRQQTIELEETVWQTASMVRQELSKKEWYWGVVGKNVVQKVLAGQKMGSFLVRDSSSNIGTYVLAIKLEDVEMIPIKAVPRGWCLSDHSLHFASVVDLVMYYSKNSLLEVSLALNVKLSNPVAHAKCDKMAAETSGSESPMIDVRTRIKKDYLNLDLGPVDLSVLAEHIPSIAPHWELIGTGLGVGRIVLSIRATERSPASKCLSVLEAWVEAGKEVSWKKLFEVLQGQDLNDTVQRIQRSLQGEEVDAS